MDTGYAVGIYSFTSLLFYYIENSAISEIKPSVINIQLDKPNPKIYTSNVYF